MTPRVRETFLEAIAAGWTVKHAAERAGSDRRKFYELRTRDDDFAAGWEQALEAGTERLEDELHRRATEGYDEDSFDGAGKLIRRVRRYSPALLIFTLKARNPAKYRDIPGRLELTGAGGGPLQVEDRGASLVDVAKVLLEIGALDQAAAALRGEVIEQEPIEVGEFTEIEAVPALDAVEQPQPAAGKPGHHRSQIIPDSVLLEWDDRLRREREQGDPVDRGRFIR